MKTTIPSIEVIKSKYLASAVKPSQYPEGTLPEIAFLGRSNVGKSSLINSLCNHRGLALVSGTPGKTRTINFFEITIRQREGEKERRQEWMLVDLPGYGYAKTGRDNKKFWSTFIADYVENAERLALLCLLIDMRHPDLPIDKEAYEWLVSHGVPLMIVSTKADKLNMSEKQKAMNVLKANYPALFPPVGYSSLKHTGRSRVLQNIAEVLEETASLQREN